MTTHQHTNPYMKRLLALPTLNLDDVPRFGSERETERAVFGYNRMLERYASGHEDIGRIALDKLVVDHPLFVEAKHAHALVLAADRRFREAERSLRELLLLDISDDEERIIREALTEIMADGARAHTEWSRHRAASDRLVRVRAALASSSILQPAGQTQSVTMASAREIDEVKRQIERGETKTGVDVGAYRSPVHSKTIPFVLVGLLAMLIVVLLYAYWWAPRRATEHAIRVRLVWLETRLKQATGGDVAALRDAYQRFVETGK